MANHPSAKKRARSSLRKSAFRAIAQGKTRALEKKIRKNTANKADRSAELNVLTSLLDKMAQKGYIHPNKAARKKSRIHRMLKTRSS